MKLLFSRLLFFFIFGDIPAEWRVANRNNNMRNREDNEIVPYVPVERVDEVEEPVEINLNVFGFVRSVVSESEVNNFTSHIVLTPTCTDFLSSRLLL